MRLASVMQEIADRLDTITGLRVHAFPADVVHPPALVFSYPETYEYDSTYGRGMDRITLPAIVVVGRVSDRASRDVLSDYVDGSGTSSIKQVAESGTYTAFDSVRVMSVEFDAVTIAGQDYLAGLFSFDIAGKGAP